MLPVLVVMFVGSLLLFHGGEKAVEESALDSNLCPTDLEEITASAFLLVDLQKPLHNPPRVGAILHELSQELHSGAELQVFALTANPQTPVRPIGRLCKPYDNVDLFVATAKDQRHFSQDCEDLPAQLAPGLRTLASRFCAGRGRLEDRVNAIASVTAALPVANAHLAEALDETLREFARRPGTPALYVFSDMLQHADWYSQLELGLSGWLVKDPAALREARGVRGRIRWPTDLRVKIFYVPRVGLTESPRAKRVHQEFWKAYFEGADVVFEEQPPLPQYAAVPLMNLPARTESAAREREQLQRQRQEAERQLAAVTGNIAELKRQNQQNEAEAQERAVRERELLRREHALETERQRLRQEELQLVADSATGERMPADFVATAQLPEIVVVRPPARTSSPELEALMPCESRLAARFEKFLTGNRYPGNRRVDFGAATIAVRYTVDEQGATVDDEVRLITNRSSATDTQHFEELVQNTVDVIKSWEFSIEGDGPEACARRHQRSVTFTYVKKCRGAPMPSCQTVPLTVEHL